ncbi:hypothetical protein, partial [Mesorhizobium sp. M2C.T.Ca.TU.002.02.1.1]|uniref:hypothetical protein n=1 Tax=Mesorhizobium sp. M2C.T.Ca.TU.002.02.1.1 TaxID=2496788 RepID=UPI000FD604C3
VDAVAVGVSFGASGGVSGSVAAAGAIAIINSTNLVSASIVADSDVDATLGSVILSATDETLFTSDVDSVSVSGAISGGAGIALSIAYAQSNTSIDGTVRTEINDSDVDAGTDIMLTSLADGVIDADGVGVSVSLSAAVGFSLSGAGAGVIITNVIGQDVIAEIGDSEAAEGQGATAGNDVLLSATDSIKSTADASAATVSGAASFAAGALAISAARASNSLEGTTRAGIKKSKVQATGGDVDIKAKSESELIATPEAYALAAAAGFGGAAAGAGAEASNTVTRTTEAFIRNQSDVRALNGLLTVEAHDLLKAKADVDVFSLSVGMASFAAGVALASNNIASVTTASVEGSTVQSGLGNLLIDADSQQLDADLITRSDAAAIGAGIGVAAVGVVAEEVIASRVEAFASGSTLIAAGQVNVDADSNHRATPEVFGLSASLGVAISVVDATAIVSGATRAYIDGNSTVSASGDTNVTADSLSHALPDGDSVAVGGGIGGAAAIMDAQVNRVTEAFVGRRASKQLVVDTRLNSIQLDQPATPWGDAEIVTYSAGGGTAIGGLVSGKQYYVFESPDGRIMLAEILRDGGNNIKPLAEQDNLNGRIAIDLTSLGSGTNHQLIRAGLIADVAFNPSEVLNPVPLTTTVLDIGAHKLNVLANSTYEARADSLAAGFGLLGGASVAKSSASVVGDTLAYVGEGATVKAGGLDVKAVSHDGAYSLNEFYAIGGAIAVNVTIADATIDSRTEAFIGTQAGVTPTSGAPTVVTLTDAVGVDGRLLIDANGSQTATAEAKGIGASFGVSVNVLLPTADVSGAVRAYVGENTTVVADRLDVLAHGDVMDATATVRSGTISGIASVTGLSSLAKVTGEVEAFIGAHNDRGASATLAPQLTISG